jgi:transcription elongation factor GreA
MVRRSLRGRGVLLLYGGGIQLPHRSIIDMTTNETVYLTSDGLVRMKEELKFLRTKERARIAEEIAEARAQGDLSENAEYDAAKEAQGHLEAKIARMEATIASARLVEEKDIDASKAFILSNVRVKNLNNGMDQVYTLVAPQEADLATGRLSVASPVGKGLLGKSVGDTVEIKIPAGTLKLEILEITR